MQKFWKEMDNTLKAKDQQIKDLQILYVERGNTIHTLTRILQGRYRDYDHIVEMLEDISEKA